MGIWTKALQARSQSVLKLYLLPTFRNLCLRELTRLTIQRFLVTPALQKLSHESRDKIRDGLSSVLRSAVDYGLLVKNPLEGIRLPAEKIGRRRSKPYVTPQHFEELLSRIPEAYASMVFVAIYTGLRVSELCSLRWNDIGDSTITIDERFCRGDLGAPKSDASNTTIAVNREVIDRIHPLKLLTTKVKAGRGTRRYKVVKAARPENVVFPCPQKGGGRRANTILTRHLKPAGRAMGMPWLNWRCLPTSHAVWLKLAGADVKDAQGQMRHSRASTTMDIYQQFVPASQRS